MSFDGVPGNLVTEIIKNDAKLSTNFKDFTIFENAISQSPATGASHVGNIFGTHDYKSKGNNIDEVLSTLRKEGYFKYLPWNYIEDSYQFYYDKYKSYLQTLKFKVLVPLNIQTLLTNIIFFESILSKDSLA